MMDLTHHSIRSHSSTTFFFYCYGDHRALHSFPTRRSSDLHRLPSAPPHGEGAGDVRARARRRVAVQRAAPCRAELRSEEHTSELQSQSNLVCRLLLEKKKRHAPSH